MNKEKIINILKNFGYVITSNLLTLIVSSLVILILPKVIGMNEYGYWQLYTFYLTYIGFFHFGWCDGIYLKFGGENYSDLNKSYFASQIAGFILLQSVISIISIFASILFTDTPDTLFIFLSLSLNFVITNTRLLFVYTLQTTNRIKEASIITIADRFMYVVMLLILLFSQSMSYQRMIIADNISRLISLCYAVYICKDITFVSHKKMFQWKESWDNIKVGSNLMLANIASSLIIGIVRFAIQKGWDIATFGKVSLTLSLSNLVMTFINAISIVVFPMLKRTKPEKLSSVYKSLRSVLMLAILTILLLYYPLKAVLGVWLPAYRESFEFMGIVFPMIVFESKTSLLLNTYLKAMRQEKLIFKINFLTTIISVVAATICVWLLKSLYLSVFCIVILLAFRSTILEVQVTKLLKIDISRDIFLEFVMILIFIIGNICTTFTVSGIIYSVALILYYLFMLHSKDHSLLNNLRRSNK